MMMNRKLKAVLCLLLCAVCCVQMLAVVFASGSDETAPEETRYTNIDSCACVCYISGLTLYASADLHAKRTMSLSITCELQKLKSGDYETIKTWSASDYDMEISWSDSRLINLFATYRIKVTYTAGAESVTLYDYA
ncbi:MAG: hypothetical protein IJL25_10685 [Clostridia bacterium]|nr:hypothetical protein [Clostridia bacterium]